MSFKFFIIFLSILFINQTKASVGDPTIQTVCKIVLKDGKIIEGLITLGYGSYCGIWMNGFYLEYYQNIIYKYPNAEFFTLSSNSFTKVDSTFNFNQTHYENCRKIKFLQLVNDNSYCEEQKLIYNDAITNDTLKIRHHIERKYLVKDSIIIYSEIPSDTYLESFFDTLQTNKFIKIAAADISSFELVNQPKQKWLDMITAAKHKFDKLYAGEESTGDFIQAVWYHELILQKEDFDRLQKVIIKNIER